MDPIPTLNPVVMRDDILQGSLVHERNKSWRRWSRLDAPLTIDPGQLAHAGTPDCPREKRILRPKNSRLVPKGRRELVGARLNTARKSLSLAFEAHVWSSGVRKRRLSPPRPAASGDANAHQPASSLFFEKV